MSSFLCHMESLVRYKYFLQAKNRPLYGDVINTSDALGDPFKIWGYFSRYLSLAEGHIKTYNGHMKNPGEIVQLLCAIIHFDKQYPPSLAHTKYTIIYIGYTWK